MVAKRLGGLARAYLWISGAVIAGALAWAGLFLSANTSGMREGGFAVGAMIVIGLAVAGLAAAQLAVGLAFLWLGRGHRQLRTPALALATLGLAAGGVYLAGKAPWRRSAAFLEARGDLRGLADLSDRDTAPEIRGRVKRAVAGGARIDEDNVWSVVRLLDADLTRFLLERRAIEFGKPVWGSKTFLDIAIEREVAPDLLALLLEGGGHVELTDPARDPSPSHPLRAWISTLHGVDQRFSSRLEVLTALLRSGLGRDQAEAELAATLAGRLEAWRRLEVQWPTVQDDGARLRRIYALESALRLLASPGREPRAPPPPPPPRDPLEGELRMQLGGDAGPASVVALGVRRLGGPGRWKALVSAIRVRREEPVQLADGTTPGAPFLACRLTLSLVSDDAGRHLQTIWEHELGATPEAPSIALAIDSARQAPGTDGGDGLELAWHVDLGFQVGGQTVRKRLEVRRVRVLADGSLRETEGDGKD